MFAGNFAPAGWLFCSGQNLPISEYETLFNLIGTTYGGDGQTTFALPDLQGRIPMHQGGGFTMAEKAGVETVTLNGNPMAATARAPSNCPTCRAGCRCIRVTVPGSRRASLERKTARKG